MVDTNRSAPKEEAPKSKKKINLTNIIKGFGQATRTNAHNKKTSLLCKPSFIKKYFERHPEAPYVLTESENSRYILFRAGDAPYTLNSPIHVIKLVMKDKFIIKNDTKIKVSTAGDIQVATLVKEPPLSKDKNKNDMYSITSKESRFRKIEGDTLGKRVKNLYDSPEVKKLITLCQSNSHYKNVNPVSGIGEALFSGMKTQEAAWDASSKSKETPIKGTGEVIYTGAGIAPPVKPKGPDVIYAVPNKKKKKEKEDFRVGNISKPEIEPGPNKKESFQGGNKETSSNENGVRPVYKHPVGIYAEVPDENVNLRKKLNSKAEEHVRSQKIMRTKQGRNKENTSNENRFRPVYKHPVGIYADVREKEKSLKRSNENSKAHVDSRKNEEHKQNASDNPSPVYKTHNPPHSPPGYVNQNAPILSTYVVHNKINGKKPWNSLNIHKRPAAEIPTGGPSLGRSDITDDAKTVARLKELRSRLVPGLQQFDLLTTKANQPLIGGGVMTHHNNKTPVMFELPLGSDKLNKEQFKDKKEQFKVKFLNQSDDIEEEQLSDESLKACVDRWIKMNNDPEKIAETVDSGKYKALSCFIQLYSQALIYIHAYGMLNPDKQREFSSEHLQACQIKSAALSLIDKVYPENPPVMITILNPNDKEGYAKLVKSSESRSAFENAALAYIARENSECATLVTQVEQQFRLNNGDILKSVSDPTRDMHLSNPNTASNSPSAAYSTLIPSDEYLPRSRQGNGSGSSNGEKNNKKGPPSPYMEPAAINPLETKPKRK